MAATSRYGSMVLSRLATPSHARTFSTSLAVQFNASKVSFAEGRTNPLVGNFVPRAAELKPTPTSTPQTIVRENRREASESQASTPRADFIPPPPPPPPPAESSSSETTSQEEPSDSSFPFPYTAADSSTPFSLDMTSIISSKSAAYGQSLGFGDPLQRPKIRAKAVTGRTVFIKDKLTPTSGPTPAVAIRVLERMCREQKVKNKFHSQKFHERKGLKKKRLRSQRWRVRFKTGFKAAVSKVMELKKQGW